MTNKEKDVEETQRLEELHQLGAEFQVGYNLSPTCWQEQPTSLRWLRVNIDSIMLFLHKSLLFSSK